MCELCDGHDKKTAQFKRALANVFDALSKERISEALRELESRKPECINIKPLGEEAAVVDFQAFRISKALNTFAIPEIREIVQEIESILKPDTET